MKQDKKFLRQCVFCRTYKSKEDLIRITKSQDGSIKINNDGDIEGRSVYICKNAECVQNALKKKKIEGSLKSNLPESIKEELSTVLKN